MIYCQGYAAVEFTAAEQRTVYQERLPGEILIHEDGPPAKPKGEVEPIYDCWYVKAKLASTWPDGSGEVGKALFDGNWISANKFRADDGIREIHETCERVAA